MKDFFSCVKKNYNRLYKKRFFVILCVSLFISYLLCEFYFGIPVFFPNLRDPNVTNEHVFSDSRFDFSKVATLQNSIPFLNTIIPRLNRSSLCFENNVFFKVNPSYKYPDGKFIPERPYKLSFLVVKGTLSDRLESNVGEVNCILIPNDVTSQLIIGSTEFPEVYSTSTLVFEGSEIKLKNSLVPDFSESKIYVWPDWINLLILTLIIFLLISSICIGLMELWSFYIVQI